MVHFSSAQADVVRGSMVVITELDISRPRRVVQFGFGEEEVTRLVKRLDVAVADGEELSLTGNEMRIIYLSLWLVPEMFGSEESFYIRLGFFTEQAHSLARELLAAVDRTA